MASITWGKDVAEVYDATSEAMFDPVVLDPAVEVLFELARGGPALEFAIGTGRVALPLSARGVTVQGIELSPHMAEKLRAKPGADAVMVTKVAQPNHVSRRELTASPMTSRFRVSSTISRTNGGANTPLITAVTNKRRMALKPA